MIHNYSSDIDLAITTNGYLLDYQWAERLKRAGTQRVNFSLDWFKGLEVL